MPPPALLALKSLTFGDEAGPGTSAPSTPRQCGPSPSLLKSVHQFCSSPQFLDGELGVSHEVRYAWSSFALARNLLAPIAVPDVFLSRALVQTFAACSGQGFAPWEIHRPQQAVRELLTQGALHGSVLDCGSGIGE